MRGSTGSRPAKKSSRCSGHRGSSSRSRITATQVGHCYRCKTIIEPHLSWQWFVRTGPLAKEAIRVVEDGTIEFIPANWAKSYFEWMYNIHDWCISRQLWWGHRIPAWYCKTCGEIVVAMEDPGNLPEVRRKRARQDEDVLDTWFSSALWPF